MLPCHRGLPSSSRDDLFIILHFSGFVNTFFQISENFFRGGKTHFPPGKASSVESGLDFLSHLFKALAQLVNQLELHPACPQKKIVEFCKAHNILPEAWAPLQRGGVFNNPAFVAMGNKYGKAAGQIALRWLLQLGVCPLPKSVTPARIEENAALFDFALTESDMVQLDADGVSATDNYHRDPHTTAF